MAANQLLRALLVCRRAEDDVLELCTCSPYLAPLLGVCPTRPEGFLRGGWRLAYETLQFPVSSFGNFVVPLWLLSHINSYRLLLNLTPFVWVTHPSGGV